MHMPRMIQIRNVPDDLHRRLKIRAAAAGKTLTDYLLEEVTRIAEKPTLDELWQRIKSRAPVNVPEGSIADAIRAGREEREDELGL
jgi:antitoxin FitA